MEKAGGRLILKESAGGKIEDKDSGDGMSKILDRVMLL